MRCGTAFTTSQSLSSGGASAPAGRQVPRARRRWKRCVLYLLQAASAAACVPSTAKPTARKIVQTRRAFLGLLAEGTGFYKALAMKLQTAYGDAKFQFAPEEAPSIGAIASLSSVDKGQDVRQSVYRCLICLGDLARYFLDCL